MWIRAYVFLIGAVCMWQIISKVESTVIGELFQMFDSNVEHTSIYTCDEVDDITCTEPPYGIGLAGHKVWAPCGEGMVGNMTAVCNEDGKYEQKEDNCVLAPIQEMLDKSKTINDSSLPNFLEELRNVTVNNTEIVSVSPATISSIVTILNNVASKSPLLTLPLNKKSTTYILETAGVLTSSGSKGSWDALNKKDGKENQNNNSTIRSTSSALLNLFESVSENLVNESFAIETSFIQLNKTMFENHFHHDFNFSVEIDIPEASGGSQYITTIVFASMDNVLPPRNEDNSSSMVINGKVVLAKTAAKIRNISITSGILNDTLENPKCVFWNFTLFDG
ncbi:adhesion G-protein coupled receptor F1-like, partial [Poecilia formosa]|uniref:adhesion G-protein coupled receptor F1-like n=2 Tax=Poecilia TaxID=8080 RepID=UPI0007B897C9